MSTDYKYSTSNRQALHLTIQKQLSEKQKNFSEFFIPILECTFNSEHSEKNESHSSNSSEVIDSEKSPHCNA